ncbi:hypothetical protein N9290_01665 [Flavobacteriaceae bacterium]|jgi:hypothetical protein|nr:hypothetical protein [Flavobacteriaceae bacterium]MDB4559831.1 hypothetical protein [Flavobacteriaceae bacterium]MDC3285334.1 hypothetical protein [Flavobacteriaceae bacterium]MDC3319361.1 hypothetical protein [Flavobacteriaceae bacterium]
MCTFTYAQKVSVATDTTNIRIGEQFLFKIVIKDTANVIFPEKLENLTKLEVVKDIKIDTFKNSLIKKYLMTGFDSGAFYIPTQQIFIKNRAYLSDSVLINVATIAVDTSQQKPFPIKSIQTEPLVYDDFKPYLIWVVLALLLIGLFIYYLKTRKKPEIKEIETVDILPPYEEALEKLQELDDKLLWQNNEIKKYYSELTEIVRVFIEKELEIPALEITTFELISLLSDYNTPKNINITKETVRKLNALLQEADLVKFAKSTPLSHEIEEDRRVAEKVLNDLRPIPLIEEIKENELE